MKKAMIYGTVVLALAAAPAMAQQPSGGSTGAGTTPTQGGSGTSGTQGGTRDGGATDQGGSTRSGSGGSGQSGTSGQGGSTRPQGSASSQASTRTNPDHDFILEAAMGGMAEVELGQLATEKAQSDQVKQFAQRMVTDHGKANDELKSLVSSKNINLPTDSGAHHKAIKDRLSKLSGAAFDRAYMQEMVTDHRKDVNAFKKESTSGKDPDVKAWAAKTLPTLQEHLQVAQSASRGAVGTSGTRTGTPEPNAPTTPQAPRGTTGTSPHDPSGSDAPVGTPSPR
ncbi:MAG: DUF4142 domain-containing protein [Vicinamibacterales bacterium]